MPHGNERRRRIEEVLATAPIHDRTDKIERWIRQVAARHIAVGEGQWVDSTLSPLGKPIYSVSAGRVALLFSQTGFTCDGPSSALTCRYDEIDAIQPPSLRDYMRASGDADTILISLLTMRSEAAPRQMGLPARLGWVTATLLSRIVNNLTESSSKAD